MNAFDPGFMNEVERIRESGLVGRSGRLRELFDFLAARGPDAESASQSEIAETVEDSYRMIAPKRLVAQLDDAGR